MKEFSSTRRPTSGDKKKKKLGCKAIRASIEQYQGIENDEEKSIIVA